MSDSPDRHHRPLVGGIVINPARPRDDTVEPIKNGAGTLTCIARRSVKRVLVTNLHVMAGSPDFSHWW